MRFNKYRRTYDRLARLQTNLDCWFTYPGFWRLEQYMATLSGPMGYHGEHSVAGTLFRCVNYQTRHLMRSESEH